MAVEPMTPTLGNSRHGASRRRTSPRPQTGNSDGRHTYAISVDRNGLFRWTLFGPNGQIVAASEVGFVSELTVERALRAEAERRSVEIVPRFGQAA